MSSIEKINWHYQPPKKWLSLTSRTCDLLSRSNYIRQQATHLCQRKAYLEQQGLSPEEAQIWEKSICGYQFLLMWINYFYWENRYDISNVNQDSQRYYAFFDFYWWQEKQYPFFSKENWWLHYWLLQIAREQGLYWFYKRFSKEKNQFLSDLTGAIEENYFVGMSVNFRGSLDKDSKYSHIVAVIWYDLDRWILILNDPYAVQPYEVDINAFLEKFNGSVFMISEKPDEELLVSSPFLAEKEEYPNSSHTVVWIHHDETSAYKFIDLLEVDKVKLTQNHERSIRFRINDTLLRVDPNRIFSDYWALKSVLTLNKHIIPSNIQDIEQLCQQIFSSNEMSDDIKKVLEVLWNIREYVLSKFDLTKPLVSIHNNRLMNVKKDFSKQFCFVSERFPLNCFVLVTSMEDFNELKSYWINVVFQSNVEWDWSLSDFAIQNWIRYFNIETWYDNESWQYQEFIYNKIKEIIQKNPW